MSARRVATGAALVLTAFAHRAEAQAEIRPWGTIEGMRVDGQRIPFEMRLCTVNAAGEPTAQSWKEAQRSSFTRSGATRTVTTRLRALAITESVDSTARGRATVRVRFTADSAASADGGALCVVLPRREWAGARVARGGIDATMVRVIAPRRSLGLDFDRTVRVVVRDSARSGGDIRLVANVLPADAAKGSSAELTVMLSASAPIDRSPVTVSLDLAHPGPRFDGMGGNFRVEDTPSDPPVVAYNLANLRVAWGRVEIPWRAWQPTESSDPSRLPPDSLDPKVRRDLEMARDLARRGIPFVASVWFPPRWAVIGELPDARPEGGPTGNPLDPAKLEATYASLGAYLLYLKQHYGAEPAYVSFNESDIGIDVRQTPAEHDAFIKGFGAWLAAHGFATKMLLGDVSDATPTWFIGAAMADTAAHRYIGAVSYHSWRGWSDSLLGFWGNAARVLGKPLLVAEGSIDAGAWRYPQVFLEPWYALQEAKVYVRVLALSQPASIMPWELTSDYSLLAGGGIFRDSSSAMHPTERFFVVKQLASVPAGVLHVPVNCDRAETSCAALADSAGRRVVVHLVNDGASRRATVRGLPAGVRSLRVFVTDAKRGMAERPRLSVTGGAATLQLDATSFTTLVAGP